MKEKQASIQISESTLNSNLVALKLHTMGMTPKCINEFVNGTYKNVRRFKSVSPEIQFSRGSSVAWTHKKLGFKYSNILFRLYLDVSGDKTLCNEPSVEDIVSTWSAAQIIYPELLTKQICDITRFSYLIRRIIDHTMIIDKCCNSKCSSKFIRDYGFIKKECWSCVDSRENEVSVKVIKTTPTERLTISSIKSCNVDKNIFLASENSKFNSVDHLPISRTIKAI